LDQQAIKKVSCKQNKQTFKKYFLLLFYFLSFSFLSLLLFLFTSLSRNVSVRKKIQKTPTEKQKSSTTF